MYMYVQYSYTARLQTDSMIPAATLRHQLGLVLPYLVCMPVVFHWWSLLGSGRATVHSDIHCTTRQVTTSLVCIH